MEATPRRRPGVRHALSGAYDLVVLDVPLRVEDIELDPGSRSVRRGGEWMDLTTAEFDVLRVLMAAAARTVSRDELFRAVTSLVLFQSAPSSVLEKTTFGMPFIKSATAPVAEGQYLAIP